MAVCKPHARFSRFGQPNFMLVSQKTLIPWETKSRGPRASKDLNQAKVLKKLVMWFCDHAQFSQNHMTRPTPRVLLDLFLVSPRGT